MSGPSKDKMQAISIFGDAIVNTPSPAGRRIQNPSQSNSSGPRGSRNNRNKPQKLMDKLVKTLNGNGGGGGRNHSHETSKGNTNITLSDGTVVPGVKDPDFVFINETSTKTDYTYESPDAEDIAEQGVEEQEQKELAPDIYTEYEQLQDANDEVPQIESIDTQDEPSIFTEYEQSSTEDFAFDEMSSDR